MMSPEDDNNERPNSEIDPIRRQINERTNASLESTRNMVTLANETHDIGVNTLVMLGEQGEKLSRIENGMDTIHAEMTRAEKNLTDLNKCCGLCVLPWQRARRSYEPFKNTTTVRNDSSSNVTTKEPKVRAKNDQGTAATSTNYIERITNDDRETEMERNLEAVGDFVGQLKNMATDMNSKVQEQIVQIDHITNKTEYEGRRVASADKETKDLLRRI